MPMMLRSGRLTGTRGILHEGSATGWYMYIKPSEQKEAQAMLRGEIPILVDPHAMLNWLKDPNRDDRPSPEDRALAHTMLIARGIQVRVTSRALARGLSFTYFCGKFSPICELSQPIPP